LPGGVFGEIRCIRGKEKNAGKNFFGKKLLGKKISFGGRGWRRTFSIVNLVSRGCLDGGQGER